MLLFYTRIEYKNVKAVKTWKNSKQLKTSKNVTKRSSNSKEWTLCGSNNFYVTSL